MKSKKNTKSLFKDLFKKRPKLQFGNNASLTPEKVSEQTQPGQPFRNKRSKMIKLIGLIILLGLMKVFNVDGSIKNWFDDYQSQFQQPAPEPIESGTVCNLLIALEEDRSVLLQAREDQALDQLDTLILHGLSPDSIDAVVQAAEHVEAQSEAIDLNELVYFEALTQQRTRLIFSDGTTRIHDLATVLQHISERDKCHFFQSVSFEGQAYEYFNILYTESFEKINCPEGPFYRARLNISEGKDPAIRILRSCGTDLFSAYIYQKTRRRLEFLNPNTDYSYQREIALSGCRCDAEPEMVMGNLSVK